MGDDFADIEDWKIQRVIWVIDDQMVHLQKKGKRSWRYLVN